MGLNGALQLFFLMVLPRNSSSSSINKGDPLAPTKRIVPCNIPMGLIVNHYIKKYMYSAKIWNYYINMNIVMH
jgi:hypothetical protein